MLNMKKITLKTKNNAYDILIGTNIAVFLSEYISIYKKILIVYSYNINECDLNLYINILKAKNLFQYKIIDNEENKSTDEVMKIIDVLYKNNFERNSLVISIGGGVVSDIVGFTASIYKRGISYINIPTTTLSMIDASIGGKTGVNYNNLKNMIGSFYQPKAVIIDLIFLKSLPIKHFNNGLVEGVKAGLIGDKKLFELFENSYLDNIEEIIYKSLIVKKLIVEEDELEVGKRKLLNLGHTFGHAIESIYLDKIHHGEAVGLGFKYVIRNEEVKLRVLKILEKLGVDLNVKIDINTLIEKIKNDKKVIDDSIDLIVCWGIEDVRVERIRLVDLIKYEGV